MLLTVMILCAAGVLLLFAFGALSDLWDVWSNPNPDHKLSDEEHHVAKPRSR